MFIVSIAFRCWNDFPAMRVQFWDLMKEWSKHEYGNLVFISEYASPEGDENWKCVWHSEAPKGQKPTRRWPNGPPTEKLFMFRAVRRGKRERNSKRKRS